METKLGAVGVDVDGDRQQEEKCGPTAAAAGKLRPRTDNSDYLLPRSSTAYLDIIDDTGIPSHSTCVYQQWHRYVLKYVGRSGSVWSSHQTVSGASKN